MPSAGAKKRTDKKRRAGCVSGAAPVFFGSVPGLFPENEADGRSLEAEALAQVILQIALVGEVHQLLAVDEKYERRRAGALLGRIVDLEAAAAGDRWLEAGLRIGQSLVEHARGDAAAVLFIGGLHGGEHGIYPLAGKRGQKQHRRVAHELEIA